MYRRARFIWASEQATADIGFRKLLVDGPQRRHDGTNRWYLFRREFQLEESVSKATLDITVDGRYQLFVNGHFVGRGPCRSSPAYQRYDSHEVARCLRPGANAVAVLVHVYGVDTAWYETARDFWQSVFGDGALYCDLDIRGARDAISIVSDERWSWLRCKAWRSTTPRSGWGQGFIEDHDAREMPEGWIDPGFDDAGWPKCKVLVADATADDLAKGWNPVEPFPTLLPRGIPPLAESPVAPGRIVAIHGLRPQPHLPIERRIYEEPLTELPGGLVAEPQALLANDDRATIVRTRESCDVSLLIAFDQRHAGHPFIELEAEGGEVIEVAVAETIPGEYGKPQPGIPRISREGIVGCAHVFRYTARPGRQRFEKFEWTAVKYLQLAVRNAPRGIRIRHVGSTSTRYPVLQLGVFECSSEFLTRLWNAGAYTALQCTHDAWEDCPSRECRQWLGDGIVHYLVSAAAFGPSTQPVDRQFLLQGMESQRPDGLLQMFAPGDHHGNGVIIPDFNLHWICAAGHYLLHTGDDRTIEELFPAIQRSLAWFERQLGPSGLLTDVPYWHFIEWANVGRRGDATIVNSMFVGALGAAAMLAHHLGYPRAERRYTEIATKVSAALNERHWDERRGVYVDTVDPVTGAQHPQVSQQANGAAILWGIAPRYRWDRIIEYVTDESRLRLTACPSVVPTGERLNPQTDVVRTNTYFSHFLYGALAKARRVDLALTAMQRYYGPMLDSGTETLWESFEPTASLCHAFSATPVHQLSAHVLGVAPLEPGFRRFLVAPQVADLEFARGAYPTPHGEIDVSWRRTSAGLELELRVPSGTEAEVVAPEGYAPVKPCGPFAAGPHRLHFIGVSRATSPVRPAAE